jgi:hypothetical protein
MRDCHQTNCLIIVFYSVKMRFSNHKETAVVSIYFPAEVIPDNHDDCCYYFALNLKLYSDYANNVVLRFKSRVHVFLKVYSQISRSFY